MGGCITGPKRINPEDSMTITGTAVAIGWTHQSQFRVQTEVAGGPKQLVIFRPGWSNTMCQFIRRDFFRIF
ncbi:hypothetical protein I7I48_07808 [Histoplasma ohiense]|nr:hypothetical protein I7I48_07808 [Histoplasma ohiense (nom. inval.)]